MQSFGAAAEAVAAKISFEYFHFETWAEQSGYLEIEDGEEKATASEQSPPATSSSHYLLQTAAKAHEIVAQIHAVLVEVEELLKKNQIANQLDKPERVGTAQQNLPAKQDAAPSSTVLDHKFSLPGSVSFKPGVERAVAASSRLKLRLGKETGKLRKLRFGWNLFGEDSDLTKLEDLVQLLRYWNEGLWDILTLQHQQPHSMMTQVRVLGHLNGQRELVNFGNASRTITGNIYQDIYVCCGMKRERLETGPELDEQVSPVAQPLELSQLPQLSESSPASVDYRLTSFHSSQGSNSEANRVVVGIVDFRAISNQDSLEILHARISRLSHLLKDAARPTDLYLPMCEGYVRATSSKFFILYRPPNEADRIQHPRTLLCMLPPSLEERYALAKLLAEGLLRLHSISWLHKCFDSNNILFFHGPDKLMVSHPVLVGFGLGRTSDKSSETIDVRQIGS